MGFIDRRRGPVKRFVGGFVRGRRGQVPLPNGDEIREQDWEFLCQQLNMKIAPSERDRLKKQIKKYLKSINYPENLLKITVRVLRKQKEGKELDGEEKAVAIYVDWFIKEALPLLADEKKSRTAFPQLWEEYPQGKDRRGAYALAFLVIVIIMILAFKDYLKKFGGGQKPPVGPTGEPTPYVTVSGAPYPTAHPTLAATVTAGPPVPSATMRPSLAPTAAPEGQYSPEQLMAFAQELNDQLPEVQHAGNQIWVEDNPEYILESDKFCPSPEDLEELQYEVSLAKKADIPAFAKMRGPDNPIVVIPLKKTEYNGTVCYTARFLEANNETLDIIRHTANGADAAVYSRATSGLAYSAMKKKGITVWIRSTSGSGAKFDSKAGFSASSAEEWGQVAGTTADDKNIYVYTDTARFVKLNNKTFSNWQSILSQLK